MRMVKLNLWITVLAQGSHRVWDQAQGITKDCHCSLILNISAGYMIKKAMGIVFR